MGRMLSPSGIIYMHQHSVPLLHHVEHSLCQVYNLYPSSAQTISPIFGEIIFKKNYFFF